MTTTNCLNCDQQITHGGTPALDRSTSWFGSDDDFMCPDGETRHEGLIGRDVDVYFNLHRKMWSVRDRRSRRVVAHVRELVLGDVSFRVSAAGNARVRAEGRKNVHAFARGTVLDVGHMLLPSNQSVSVTYNPYRYTTFVEERTETPVHTASIAWFGPKTLFVEDPSPSPVKGYRGMTRAVQKELDARSWSVAG